MNFAIRAACVVMLCIALSGCSASYHPTSMSTLGSTAANPLPDLRGAGPIVFERIVAADWEVDRSGLINLDHPAARAAGIEAGPEPIQIFLYVLSHPDFGTYLVDSGVERGFLGSERNPKLSRIVATAMNLDALRVHTTTAEVIASLEARGRSVAGVFLTHLHLDHVMGLPDLARDVPVYVGPGEPGASAVTNLVIRGTVDRMLEGLGPLREWNFAPDPAGRWEGMLDVFGDGSVFALHVPGHTPGSTAFLVRSTQGAKLLVGDACHTRFGWEQGVEPGTFSSDGPRSAVSLAALRAFANEHPQVEVHVGHQDLGATAP